jgi:hypothetical protein
VLAACSSDSGSADSSPPDCLANGTNISIGTNHGHTLTVPVADLNAGVDKTYDIMGSSIHTHSVTITAAQFTMLKANTSIMVTSTVGSAHTHVVTVGCA